MQNNRKIVAAGYTADSGHKYFALIRYHEDGVPDNSFGRDGMVTTHIGGARNIARSTAIQTDGKIIVAGITFNGTDWDAALTRYNTDGRLDSTFGINGIVTAGGSGDDEVYSVAIQPDGRGSEKIIVAGYSDESGNPHFMLIRFNPNGIIDSSFGTAGIVITPIGVESEILSSTIQENGKVIAAGYSYNGSDCDFIIARYNQDGNQREY
ncbi:MAG: delta-60 repeat domain-containing protein [Ignavibacteriaceae bacterium]